MSAKSASKAEAIQNGQQNNDGGAEAAVQDCPKTKHFIKIKVEDRDGAAVTKYKPKIELNDGTVIAAAKLNSTGAYDSGKVMDGAGVCKISFPDLWDSDWWPEGGSAAGASANQEFTIADGDCVVKLVADHGFLDYQSIWGQAKNDTLKADRPNPNSLKVGDKLWAPDKADKVEQKAVDQEWKFIVAVSKPPKLGIIAVNFEEKPLNECEWELSGVVSKKGKTGADGLIEIPELDPTKVAGTLKLKPKKPPTPAAAAKQTVPAATDPPAYPPVIVFAEFKDKQPEKPSADKLEWTLKVGSLPAHKDKTGVLARLRNLGYGCDVDADDPKMQKFVKLYQKAVLKEAAPSGNQADIQQSLDDRHSKP
jgi:hypothetical protein